MAKLTKPQLIAELKKLDIEVNPADKLTNPKLEKMLVKAQKKADKEATDETSSEETEKDKAPGRLKSEDSTESEKASVVKTEKDYLQKYQYGKEMPLGHINTNPPPGSKRWKMKEKLLKQPRVKIVIPRLPDEDPSILLSVNLNGYRMDFTKNEYIEVPEQVAKIIMKSQKQTDKALRPFRLDLADKPTKKALDA